MLKLLLKPFILAGLLGRLVFLELRGLVRDLREQGNTEGGNNHD